MASKESVEQYLAENNIASILQGILDRICKERPDKPVEFLLTALKEEQARPRKPKFQGTLTDYTGYKSGVHYIDYLLAYFNLSYRVDRVAAGTAQGEHLDVHDAAVWQGLPRLESGSETFSGAINCLLAVIDGLALHACLADKDRQNSEKAIELVAQAHEAMLACQFAATPTERRYQYHLTLHKHGDHNAVHKVCTELEGLFDDASEYDDVPWFGAGPTPGDLVVAAMLDMIHYISSSFIIRFPRLEKLRRTVAANTAIKAVIKTQNVKPFFREWAKRTTWSKILPENTPKIDEYYELGQQLGQPGQFGAAFRVTAKPGSDRHGTFAAKRIVKGRSFRSSKERRNFYTSLWNEILVMKALDNEHIIEIYEVYEDAEYLWLVMEYCSGGELFDFISAQGNVSENKAAQIAKQIILGIEHMHINRIAHCDLKPDNFIFKESDGATLKIIDFGLSKLIGQPWSYLKSFRGTSFYVAPEVLDGKYLESCDIWSFGVVVFVMLFGYPPFHGSSDDLIFRKIKQGFTPEVKDGYGAWFPRAVSGVSECARSLIAGCLDSDPKTRLTAKEIIAHKWFHGGAPEDFLTTNAIESLKSFEKANAFKEQVLGVMTDVLSDEELKDLKDMFNRIDANGDGFITPAELSDAIEKLEDAKAHGVNGTKPGMPKTLSKVQALMKSADLDGDGQLDYKEMLLTCVDRKVQANAERMFVCFQKFDLDGDMKISKEEIVAGLNVSMEEAEKIMSEIDEDGDGTVDFDEFSTMMGAKKEAEYAALIDH